MKLKIASSSPNSTPAKASLAQGLQFILSWTDCRKPGEILWHQVAKQHAKHVQGSLPFARAPGHGSLRLSRLAIAWLLSIAKADSQAFYRHENVRRCSNQKESRIHTFTLTLGSESTGTAPWTKADQDATTGKHQDVKPEECMVVFFFWRLLSQAFAAGWAVGMYGITLGSTPPQAKRGFVEALSKMFLRRQDGKRWSNNTC